MAHKLFEKMSSLTQLQTNGLKKAVSDLITEQLVKKSNTEKLSFRNFSKKFRFLIFENIQT